MSAIPEALLLAYLRTHYRVLGDAGFVLRIGERSGELAALFERLDCRCAAFLTAWNPRSEPASAEFNRRSHELLLGELRARGLDWIEGIGEDTQQRWPGEQSVLVPGLTLGDAMLLAQSFEQNALVWAGPQAFPQLVLLG